LCRDVGMLTSTVVSFLHPDLAQCDGGLDVIDLIHLSSTCQHKEVSVQESDHVLTIHAISYLPGYVKNAA